MNYIVELAKEENIKQIRQLILDRCLWFKENSIAQWTEEYFNEYNVEYFRELIKENRVYVIKDNDKVIGTFTLKETNKYWQDDGLAMYIRHLVTSLEYRGIGKLLIDFALEEVRKHGKKFLRLDCFTSNKVLNEYYNKLGFICFGSGYDSDEDYYYNLHYKQV